MKYYLISYRHSTGYGNIFFKSNPYLDIRAAEKFINDEYDLKKVSIVTINEILKEQWELSNK